MQAFYSHTFMKKKIVIINGPNLNLVGKREPSLYGHTDMSAFIDSLVARYSSSASITYRQSNVEGELIDFIQQADGCDGIVLNAGGYTHTSVAIADAVAACSAPVVEVHISNILAREELRHVSLLSKSAVGSVIGFGLDGYDIAIKYLIDRQ